MTKYYAALIINGSECQSLNVIKYSTTCVCVVVCWMLSFRDFISKSKKVFISFVCIFSIAGVLIIGEIAGQESLISTAGKFALSS